MVTALEAQTRQAGDWRHEMDQYPLYDPLQHHDACGVGFVADRSTQVSHRIVRLGVE